MRRSMAGEAGRMESSQTEVTPSGFAPLRLPGGRTVICEGLEIAREAICTSAERKREPRAAESDDTAAVKASRGPGSARGGVGRRSEFRDGWLWSAARRACRAKLAES